MSGEPDYYDDESLNGLAIWLAVETGVPPETWLEQGITGMNTAAKYVRERIKREASYLGAKFREGPEADPEGRQMSG